jgi:hypothetical protein
VGTVKVPAEAAVVRTEGRLWRIRLAMKDQLEAFGEQRPEHHHEVVIAGPRRSLRVDVIAIFGHPLRAAEDLRFRHIVGASDAALEGDVASGDAANLGVYGGTAAGLGLTGFDGGHFKRRSRLAECESGRQKYQDGEQSHGDEFYHQPE